MASTNVVIDLTNFKDRVGSRVPEGTYKVIIDDVEPDTAKSGNPMVNVWFRIHGGDYDGQTITDRLVLTEKSMFRVVGFLQALGIKTPKKRLSIDISKFVGRSMEITVRDGDPYNGRVKSEVSGYARITEKAAKASEADIDDVEEPAEEPEAEAPAEEAKPAPAQAAAAAEESDDDSQGEVDLDDLDNL